MSSRCQDLRRRLTLEGARSLADDEAAQEHLATCEECFAILEGLDELDRALTRLPVIEPPEVALDQLAARVAVEPFDDEAAAGPSWRQRSENLLGQLLAPLGERSVRWRLAAVLVAGLGTAILVPALRDSQPPEPPSSDVSTVDAADLGLVKSLGYLGGGDGSEGGEAGGLANRPVSGDEAALDQVGQRRSSELRGRALLSSKVATPEPSPHPELGKSLSAGGAGKLGSPDNVAAAEAKKERRSGTPGPADELATFREEIAVAGKAIEVETTSTRASSVSSDESRDEGDKDSSMGVSRESEILFRLGDELEIAESVAGKPDAATDRADFGGELVEDLPVSRTFQGLAFAAPGVTPGATGGLGDDDPSTSASAEQFLAERQRIDGLTFRDAIGYWRNTYVPGDPVLRLLSSRLLGSPPPGAGIAASQQDALARLHDGVRRPAQPFDPPQGAALGLALSADRRAVAGESRVLLQAGLQATERRAGRRPPLDLALVLDLSGELSPDAAASVRALVMALSSARQPDDRFRLIVAGRPGGVLIEADGFRFGPLQVALDQLFGVGGSARPTLDLPSALRTALEALSDEERPGSPLGSSAILLATSRTYGDELATVEAVAHAAAVASVPLSAIGLAGGVDAAELDRLAVAGQGSRRLLTTASGAGQLVDRELAAASRAVARAVRLSIRLAPGVRLVDVVGSESLDGRAAQRVRDAEQSVDLKIARSLGIAADRGEDEEGIQIVIPAFFAGDAHVVLVDLVVPGPGPVADVSVRFKDLVQSRNGVAAARLELPRGAAERGPLELNVLHNLLVLRLVDALDRAGRAAAAGQSDVARRHLESHLALLRGLGELVPGFASSREVVADSTVLEGYLALLTSGEANEETLERLADSLRYAARLKVLPAPERIER